MIFKIRKNLKKMMKDTQKERNLRIKIEEEFLGDQKLQNDRENIWVTNYQR